MKPARFASCTVALLTRSSIEELAERELQLSIRSAQRLCRESDLYENCPALKDAVAEGRIGVSAAFLVDRLATSHSRAAFIERAAHLTVRQFEREAHFLQRL